MTWHDEGEARALQSVEQVKQAETAGEVTIERPGAVVNMPVVEWPGGER